jgi:hypothetical protein
MDFIITVILLFGSVIGVGGLVYRWQFRTADAQLGAWARRWRYQILEKEPANPFGTGPKAARGSNKQVMYRVTLSNEAGARRRALIKIGSTRLGVLENALVVEWDDGQAL